MSMRWLLYKLPTHAQNHGIHFIVARTESMADPVDLHHK